MSAIVAKMRSIGTVASVALCAVGIGMVANGLAVPVTAGIGQHSLEREFEQRLQATVVPQARARATPAHGVAHPPMGGPIARISVPRLGVKEIVLGGEATHERLALGPTMLKRGNAGNPVTILAAHRDTHFLFIRDLGEGDEVIVQFVTGKTEHYRIVRFETVRWNQFAYPLDPARPLLALTTCYPFGGTEYGGPLRRVAWAEQVT